MSSNNDFENIVFMFFGCALGAGFYWLMSQAYVSDIIPMMQHGFYVFGFLVIFFVLALLAFSVDNEYLPLFIALWIIVTGLWVGFAYSIYDVMNIGITWWASNMTLNTMLILFFIAGIIIILWVIRYCIDNIPSLSKE